MIKASLTSILLCFAFAFIASIAGAKSLVDEVRDLKQHHTAPRDIKKGSVPEYDDETKRKGEEAYLSGLSGQTLESEGAKRHRSEVNANPGGAHDIVDEASDPRHVADKGRTEDLALFQRSDSILRGVQLHSESDPLASCKVAPSKKYGYTKPAAQAKAQVAECYNPLTVVCDDYEEADCKTENNCPLRGQVDGNYTFDARNNKLIFGNTVRDSWITACGVYFVSGSFTIDDLNDVTEFRLIRADIDDHMQVLINGQSVFVGPHSGDRLELVGPGSVQIGAGNIVACEQGRDWIREPNIDLKPYLRDGVNTIQLKIIVAFWGEGWVTIRYSQKCSSCQWKKKTHCRSAL